MRGTRWNDRRFTAHLASMVWTASPVVRRYLHLLASGHPGCDWVTFVESSHLGPGADRALVLGCGSGWLERGLVERGRWRRIVACDFAAETVAGARSLARKEGSPQIEYFVIDLEREELPEGPFDAIFAHDVLHHVTHLEAIYARIHGALSPNGRIFFCEYVGPNRFQYSDERMRLINDYFRRLPARIRKDPVSGIRLRRRERVDAKQLIADDPTEAVRSEDVLPLARRFFKVVTEIPYGGGLLNPLLYGVVANFREGDPRDDLLLQELCDAEDRLTRSGQLEPDFQIFVGARK